MKNWKNLDYQARCTIRNMLDQKKSIIDISKTIGCTRSTIYNELKRGSEDGNPASYDPLAAEIDYQKKQGKKGAIPFQMPLELANCIATLILEENLSPESIHKKLKEDQQGQFAKIPSARTIYAMIEKGAIPNVTREDLHSHVTVFSDGHIIIPKRIRERLNICDGAIFSIRISEKGDLLLKRKET